MLLADCLHLLTSIKGVTFASLDAITIPKPGIEARITGEMVLLYQNKNVSGYEQKVRRALEKAGKDPDAFTLGDLPWGERLEGTPVIFHKGREYLQCIVLQQGECHYYLSNTDHEIFDLTRYGIYPPTPPEHGVYVHTYRLESIKRLTLLGETILDTSGRIGGTLKIKT